MARKRRYDEFLDSMKSLLNTGKHADFVITCGTSAYNVHKAIICSQSEFFDAASRFGKEAEDGGINLSEDEHEIVKYMIQYMYELDYHVPSETAKRPWWIRINWNDARSLSVYCKTPAKRFVTDGNLWRYHAKFADALLEKSPASLEGATDGVLELEAAKLQNNSLIRSMIRLCMEVKKDEAKKHHQDASTHAKVYSIADKYNIKGLREAAAEKFQEGLAQIFPGRSFFGAVNIAFTTTPDTDHTLRDMVAKRILETKEKYGMHEKLDESLRNVPGLAYHVLRYEYSLLEVAPTEEAKSMASTDVTAERM